MYFPVLALTIFDLFVIDICFLKFRFSFSIFNFFYAFIPFYSTLFFQFLT